ncbi:uncharacterized protein LOC119072274 [Bradysia coprophila]|uniref:uncharacterized protein LOC119072274 n=1 Tax=Bradysia coprophila TaxID=38358 RepID=UPI00187DC1BA|nr:uncharacterized protein LOC119072274 [Bradysia coprophila]
MYNHLNKLDEDTIRVRNEHSVMDAIASQNNQITEDELFEQFIMSTDAPRDLIEYELKQILHNGLVGGFIAKTGNKYAIPTLENMYTADCDDSKGDERDRPDVTVRVEPAASTSSATRKRASTGPSSHEHCPKKARPCPEAVDLSTKLMKRTCKFRKARFIRMKMHIPRLFSIDEKRAMDYPIIRPPLVEGGECASDEDFEEEEAAGEEEEEEAGEEAEAEESVDDDDDEAPSACETGPATRTSTRIIIRAKGKCGGMSDPHKCSF